VRVLHLAGKFPVAVGGGVVQREICRFDLARESLPVIVGLLVLLEVLGPLATQRSLMLAHEAHPEEGR